MRRWTHAIVDTRKIINMGIIVEVEVHSVPTRLEIDLCPHPVTAIGVKHVVLFWNIVSVVYTMKTYPVKRSAAVFLQVLNSSRRTCLPPA